MAFMATTISVALQTNLSLTIVYMVQTNHDETHVSVTNECNVIRNNSFNTSRHSESSSGKLNWSTETQDYIIGLQYLGMILGYIPGGYLGELYGAKNTMNITILIASAFTIISSFAANISVYIFIICRIIVGLGTAPVFPLLVIMISKWIPKSERSFISSIMLAGFGTGASISNLTAGALCSSNFFGGWPSVFYLNGIVGIIWCICSYFLVHESPDAHPTISLKELDYLRRSIGPPKKEMKSVPWKSVATSVPVWALAIGTFGQFWLLAFFVTCHTLYLGTVLNLGSLEACSNESGSAKAAVRSKTSTVKGVNGILSCAPNLFRAVFACIVGFAIDWMRRRKEFSIVVKLNCISVDTAAACLGFVGVMYAGCDPVLATRAFILSSLCGDFCTFGVSLAPTDIAPNISGTLSGILCSIGSIPYFMLPAIVGLFTKNEQSLRQWENIFYCTIGVTIVTTLVYVFFGTSDPQPWAIDDNNSIGDLKHNEEQKCNEPLSETYHHTFVNTRK
ncbi:hypothetical protein NPIL_695401 [Nephila pilipes]|uniref:Major facilitator superfamily (MFS) profile domain-containing protein n=1 Tax=Nephila pilipes TaxID=299642 RepID=A0A8X6PGQ0_NEPPI|nr:hypothetical protein NPIL_695401 [Nephila pilipes]